MTSTTHDTTAQAILDATLHLIGEQGLKGVTTRAIAQRAGVNEVTLFRKFGSKSSLVKQAIADRFATVEEESLRYTGNIEVDLVRLARYYHDTLQAFGSAARAMLTEIPYHPELADSTAAEHLFAAIAALLRRYQDAGILQPEPPETLIPALLGPILMPYVTPHASPVFDAEAHVDRFLNGRAVRR